MSRIAARLTELGIALPEAAAPVANYVPFAASGTIVHISGQLSRGSEDIRGTVGQDVDLETAVRAARLCAINLISQFRAACDGDLERVSRVLRLGGFVQAGPGFDAIPDVINGASDLMVDVFGDRGRHARSAVGVYRIPLGYAVEVDAVIEVASGA
ncbi:RidA family protein [Sphingomonas pseudosanguinis]|uniref:Enamine deaminase RidA (YjgF/YER057c/UK114 family) n=1 Tax=Sphingomonas pseudosanguinis TaxID=413712 RepID=A0A7W6AER4_9SPHN|nr:RidA family protein [Sphingomonas pseudosanguinis]MBB3880908.1 enamine deaminase RidA (YjgF/YER057c/UK114 family) [Sphingomonas pseudosanguinis]MBN3535802.1 RidA family protein [Sphingomonas pseudosanguinis]